MVKTVSVRLEGSKYRLFSKHARLQNRTLPNFIETATLRYIEEHEEVDEFEMDEIRSNEELNRSIKRGIMDANKKRGRFVE